MTDAGPLEVEVKFLLEDLAALAGQLEASGGTLARPRVHEVNLLFDDEAGRMRARGMVLRLREDERARLTLKTPREGAGAAGEMKVREELELEVGDAAAMRQILQRLGFHATFVYEKYRTAYHLGACEVVLDETP